jgi:hypothetical protein
MIMKHISQGGLVTSVASKLHLSPTLEINELVQQTRASGKKVVHLGFGEATFPIEKGVLEEHRNASAMTSYLPVAGLQALREVKFHPHAEIRCSSHVYAADHTIVYCSIPQPKAWCRN